MNVAIVVYSHYSRDARVRRYTELLARKGHKINCICLAEHYKPKKKNISLTQYPIPRIRAGKFWYILEYLLFFLFSSIVLTFNFLIKKYKIIHINNMPDILVFSALIPKIFGAKIILDMHDPMPELYMSKYNTNENNMAVKILKIFEKISFAFADSILTANEAFKSIFLNRNPNIAGKINIILNCPDSAIFHPSLKKKIDKYFTLFYMGTIEKRFGLDIAFEAVAKLINKIPDLRFIIVPKLENEGEYFKSLKDKIRRLSISPYVEISNPMPLEDIAKKLEEADVGIVLAKNGIFTDNIFPVKLLEFIQMNIPVIATKTKILARYFTINQIYFLQQNTSEELTKAVVKLYRDNKLLTQYGINAKKYLRNYNWPKEKGKYLKIIETVILR